MSSVSNDSNGSQKRSRTDNGNGEEQKEEEKYIILNIGGTKFYTSKATLITEPSSMMGVMFSGRFSLAPASSDGR